MTFTCCVPGFHFLGSQPFNTTKIRSYIHLGDDCWFLARLNVNGVYIYTPQPVRIFEQKAAVNNILQIDIWLIDFECQFSLGLKI